MSTAERWTNAQLEQYRHQADPLADETLALLLKNQGKEKAYELFDLLIRNIEIPLSRLPEEIQPFAEQTKALPEWADANAIADAHRFFLDHGAKVLFLVFFKSLPLLYSMRKGAKVLVRTGRLTNEEQPLRIFARRIAETGQFLIDVMTPGELATNGRGIQSIQKVRLIHAAIRYFVGAEGWDERELGLPINQEDMAMTLMSFSIAVIDGLEQFGIEEPRGLQEAYLHSWNAIGHNLGIAPELLPKDVEEARQLMNTILARQSAESEEGKLLTRALTDFVDHNLGQAGMNLEPEAVIRFLIGPERARMLGLQSRYGCLSTLLPHAILAAFRLGERLEDKVDEPLSKVIELLSQRVAKGMVGYFDEHKGRSFHIPQAMQKEWIKPEA